MKRPPDWVGYLIGVALCAMIGAALVITITKPQVHNPRYVIDGGGTKLGIAWLITVPCSQPPHGWPDILYFCDTDNIALVRVTVEDYANYNQGDVYP